METSSVGQRPKAASSSLAADGQGRRRQQQQQEKERCGFAFQFQVPLHYPRYSKADYEAMPEWQLDLLLAQYGLPPVAGDDVASKRKLAISAFLWPSH